MMNKKIKWFKWKNPLTKIEDEEGGSVVSMRQTPFGVEAFKLSNDKSNSLNIFVGNTNFDLTSQEENIIKNVDGVEGLKVVSPYRFHLAIGAAFNAKTVRRSVTNALCKKDDSYSFNSDISLDIYKKTLSLNQNGKPWFIYILPNGKSKEFIFEDQDKLEKSIIPYYNVKEKIGGVILTS